MHAETTSIPHAPPESWDDGRFDIQTWLERSVERRLVGTERGVPKDTIPPRPEVWDDPNVNFVIKMDIATFLIAEEHSVRTTTAMMRIAPDERSRAFLATQVLDEARHYEVFAHRMALVGVDPAGRQQLMNDFRSKEMQTFFDLVDEQIDAGNYLGATVGQNLVLEGLAFPLYRYETRYWSYFDPGLSHIIRGAFADEVRHTSYGERYLAAQVRQDPATKNQVTKFLRHSYELMRNVFDASIEAYVKLYQAAADAHMDKLGAIEIFPGRKMADTTEEEQMRTVLHEVEQEYLARASALGIDL